jgi:ABC-type Fe3+/spermidine/putrescine transport system ATPase subunit
VSLSIRALKKSFDAHAVVRGLELDLAPGEIVALLGPSGCGKTTALRMVAGLETPDDGEIRIGDRTVFGRKIDLAPEDRNVGMVFQSYAVWPHRSVLENVAYPLRLKRDRAADQRARDALALVHLGELVDRFPGTLSGGQQQRVALARALVAHPSLLLFDEPLSNLDAKLREEMRHEIRQLAKSIGITSLYVTHDQPEAFAVSDRVAVVLDGVIAQCAAPAELYDAPADLRVARFVGRLSVLTGIQRSADREVMLGGATVPATFAASEGDLVLGVRPEAVTIGSGGIEGRIARATFLGERTELAIETAHGELRADVSASRGHRAGDSVRLHLSEGRVYRSS